MSFKIFYPASRYVTGLYLLWITLAGCASQPKVKDNPWKASGADTTPTLMGVFEGILPCADCPGIDTQLTLTKDGPYIDDGIYDLQQTYQDRNVKPLEAKGDWSTLRGDAANPDAVVYQLDPDHPEHSLYFLKIDENKLEQLDSNLKEMPSNLNFILMKTSQTQN